MTSASHAFDLQEHVNSDANADRYHELALSLAAVVALLLGLSLLAMRWRQPLLGMHSFRQTYTAITSYWLMKGSPWFAYETPVLGAPWSIPFEVPFYQLLVAGLTKATGLSLDSTGRLVSYLFLVLTIIPVRMLARAWKLDSDYIRVFAILLLTSPVYLFWGTTFLMETLVLFFCFWFLAEVELTTRNAAGSSYWMALALSIFCGVVGALGKITTFVPFGCLAGLIFLDDFLKRLRRHEALLPAILTGGAIVGIPLVLFEVWTRFADAQKIRNPIAAPYWVSSLPAAHRWYLGTWAQLFSGDMLHTLRRVLTDTLGILALPLVIASVALVIFFKILDRRTAIIVSGSISAFLLPFVLFTNVHIAHNYYSTENAIFLICALASVTTKLFATGHRQAGWSLLALTISSQLLWFGIFFLRDIRNPLNRPVMAIAQAINTKTSPDSVVVIYGQDFSPVIPYYAQRRATMEPDNTPDKEALERAQRMLEPQGGHPVESVVRCKSHMDEVPEFNRIFADLDIHVPKLTIAGCDVYFVGSAQTH
jgi:hypothetical protein